jgi:hypothetical protein
MEEETIEEAAEKYTENFALSVKSAREIGFKDGAKWMQEQMEKLKDFNTWKEWKNKQQ